MKIKLGLTLDTSCVWMVLGCRNHVSLSQVGAPAVCLWIGQRETFTTIILRLIQEITDNIVNFVDNILSEDSRCVLSMMLSLLLSLHG